jgi:hypothetical protein
MKKIVFHLGLVLSLVAGRMSATEAVWKYAVEASATVFTSPAKISLTWVADPYAVSYTVARKTPTDSAWKKLTTLPGTATGYDDISVTLHQVYEYQIQKSGNQGTTYSGYGYVQSAIDAPLVDDHGKLILIVDNTYATDLAPELARLQQDLAGDGWTVLRHDVGRTDAVTSVKGFIKSDYNADPQHVKAVFLFGHVPVPYSGTAAPDEHPSHVGAWPADAYYGGINGKWTDSTTNFVSTATDISQAERARLTNVPHDGKFDPSTIPGSVDLQVGRVDLSDLPGFLSWQADPTFPSEVDLLRNYLNKDHAYRCRLVTVPRRALLEQFLGERSGEAFGATGYRAFTAFFGPGADGFTDLNIQTGDQSGVWLPTLANNAYLWAYGDSSGSYSAVNNLGTNGPYYTATSVDLVSNDIKSVFVVFFGSWMGDWNVQDNLLRSVLATPSYGLAAIWSGRPHWFLHPMALGETIGYCARLTQNNDKTYRNELNNFTRGVHIALLGDPTLRLHPVLPPSGLQGATSSAGVSLSWSASAEADLGYHVYRATNPSGPFTRMTTKPVVTTTFVDAKPVLGATYMVRAVKLESSASGTYENASQGIFWAN